MMSFKMLQRLIKSRSRQRLQPTRSPLDQGLGFTIRFAYPDDEAALRRLAALDSQPVPSGPMLVAEVAGELWAAVGLEGDSRTLADPFHHTAALVSVLRERSHRLTRVARRHAVPPPTARLARS